MATLSREGTSEVRDWVDKVTQGYESALEFGCGTGAYTRGIKCPRRCGIEAFEPYVDEARLDPRNEGVEFFLGDMREFDKVAGSDYEVALFVDSLEHLSRRDAYSLVAKCKATFKRIAVFLPVGFHHNDEVDGNKMQLHLSTWHKEDFVRLKFDWVIHPNWHSSNPEGKQSAACLVWTRVLGG